MRKLKIEILVPEKVFLDRGKLLGYAQSVRERFDLGPEEPVSMEDLVTQAMLDGDIDDRRDFQLDTFWSELLSSEDLADLGQDRAE